MKYNLIFLKKPNKWCPIKIHFFESEINWTMMSTEIQLRHSLFYTGTWANQKASHCTLGQNKLLKICYFIFHQGPPGERGQDGIPGDPVSNDYCYWDKWHIVWFNLTSDHSFKCIKWLFTSRLYDVYETFVAFLQGDAGPPGETGPQGESVCGY